MNCWRKFRERAGLRSSVSLLWAVMATSIIIGLIIGRLPQPSDRLMFKLCDKTRSAGSGKTKLVRQDGAKTSRQAGIARQLLLADVSLYLAEWERENMNAIDSARRNWIRLRASALFPNRMVVRDRSIDHISYPTIICLFRRRQVELQLETSLRTTATTKTSPRTASTDWLLPLAGAFATAAHVERCKSI